MYENLKNRIPRVYRPRGNRESSVLIPLVKSDEGYDILFEVRSSNIGQQPGDICFPGGRVEKGETPLEGAIRETSEELLIDKDTIEVLFPVDYMPLGDSGIVYPFAAIINDYKGTFSSAEVHEILRIPLSFILEAKPEIFMAREKDILPEDFPYDKINGGRDYKWLKRLREVPFFYWEDRVIWGITGRLLQSFRDIIKYEE